MWAEIWLLTIKERYPTRYRELEQQNRLVDESEKAAQRARESSEHLYQQMLLDDPAPTKSFLKRVQHLNRLKHVADEVILHQVLLPSTSAFESHTALEPVAF